MKILAKIINLILILAAISLGLWLINRNFPADGQLVIKAVLGQDQPAISQIGPPTRQKWENGYQLILDSPVYFDVRALPWFHQARIEIVYQEEVRKLVELGGLVGEEWQYQLVKPLSTSPLDDGWQQAIFIFDLDTLRRPKNIARFLISTAGNPQDRLKIKELKVILLR